MKNILIFPIILLLFISTYAQKGYVPTEGNLQARKEFSDSKFGIFVVWGTYSMLGSGEWVMHTKQYTHNEYSRLAAGFYPSKFDADKWAKIFKASGAKYITVTARHHDGFSLFKSEATDYNSVDATPFGKDIIGELAIACKNNGLTLNIYYSHLDWGREDYYPIGKTGGYSGRKAGEENSWPHYIGFMKSQLRELLTNYGHIGCIWFDGMWDRPLKDRDSIEARWQLYSTYELIHSLQHDCLIGNNHHLPVFEGEDFQIFEKDLPGQNTTGFSGESVVSELLPLETCHTINDNWGYHMSDTNFKSTSSLIQYLVKTSGKGANLLLDVGPRPDGTIQEECVERLLEIGKWLKKYGETIYGTNAGIIPEQQWGVSTQKENKLYIHILNKADSLHLNVGNNRVVSAVNFDNGDKVKFSQKNGNVDIEVPERMADCIDQIIVLNLRK